MKAKAIAAMLVGGAALTAVLMQPDVKRLFADRSGQPR